MIHGCFFVQAITVWKFILIIKLAAGAFQEKVMPDHKVFDRSLGFLLGTGVCFTVFSWFVLA